MPPLSTATAVTTTDDLLRQVVSLATTAAPRGGPEQLQLEATCRELAACGALRRTQLVTSLRAELSPQQHQQLEPLRLVSVITSLLRCGVLGLHSLCELLPVQAAASVIQQAACSQAVVLSLLNGQQQCQAQPLTALLRALLGAHFDVQSCVGDATTLPGQQQQQQFVEQLLQSLQQAACECEVRAWLMTRQGVRK
jgi:hypothetical protein